MCAQTDVKFCQEELQFLHDNFEGCAGSTIPRGVLYAHYVRHCREIKLPSPMNPALFGKLVRLAFEGIRTRRLGTRGRSRYHYCGLRFKTNSHLKYMTISEEEMSAEECVTMDEDQPVELGMTYDNSASSNIATNHSLASNTAANHSLASVSAANYSLASNTTANHSLASVSAANHSLDDDGVIHQQNVEFIGDVSSVELELISVTVGDNELLPEGVTLEILSAFQNLYQSHCQEILEHISRLELRSLPMLWSQFWFNPSSLTTAQEKETERETGSDTERETERDEVRLTSDILYTLSSVECVHEFVMNADCNLYSTILDLLIPDITRPIPSTLTLLLRNFSRHAPQWLIQCLTPPPSSPPLLSQQLINVKSNAIESFSFLLMSYTTLNHTSSALRNLLQTSTTTSLLLQDLHQINFNLIQKEVALYCSDDELVNQYEREMKSLLSERISLDGWVEWLECLANQTLEIHVGGGATEFINQSRAFIMRWVYCGSAVLRDLTLRGAASYGTYHLLRMFCDEYMKYCVDLKLSSALNQSIVLVMCNR